MCLLSLASGAVSGPLDARNTHMGGAWYTLVSFLSGQIQTKSFPPAPGPSLCPSLPDSSHFLSPTLGHTLNDLLQL